MNLIIVKIHPHAASVRDLHYKNQILSYKMILDKINNQSVR